MPRPRGRTAATTTAAGLSTLMRLVAGGLGVTPLPRTAVPAETGRGADLATGPFPPEGGDAGGVDGARVPASGDEFAAALAVGQLGRSDQAPVAEVPVIR